MEDAATASVCVGLEAMTLGEDERVLGEALVDAFPTAQEWWIISRVLRWSPQESRVMRGLVRGEPRKRVAHVHTISKSTLETHLHRSLRKAKAANHS